ncbi:MAG: zinc-binding dehydrogenase [Chloroflexi bacterium]|nr:zinc-binding dehydrogenase [Chloroflexota bacterium]
MKALVKTQHGQGFVTLMDIDEPIAGPGEVKVRVEAAGICGSDLHIYHDLFPSWPPVVMGHEFSGVIVDLGAGVSRWQIGDRVTCEAAVQTCGTCAYCRMGAPALCPERRSLGSGVNGAFARYCLVPQEKVHRLPDNIDFLNGAMAEPLSCCVHAVLEHGHVSAADVVLVTGPGPIGLLVSQVARAQGARVILCGTSADIERLRLGAALGLDATIDGQKQDPLATVLAYSAGQGADAVFECAGAAAAAQLGLAAVKKRGRYVQVGLFAKNIELDFNQITTKELTVVGSFGATYVSWQRALELLAQGKVAVHPLITTELPLSQWEIGFTQMQQRQGCKIILRPEDS